MDLHYSVNGLFFMDLFPELKILFINLTFDLNYYLIVNIVIINILIDILKMKNIRIQYYELFQLNRSLI